jgi:FdhD protein
MSEESSKSVKALRYDQGETQACTEPLTVELPLQIKINERPFSVTMRSPGDDRHLVTGLLFTEGIVDPREASVSYAEETHADSGEVIAVNVEVPEAYLCESAFDKRSLLANASCGLEALGRKPLAPPERLPLDQVTVLMERMQAAQQVFTRTGSTHAAAAFDMSGNLLCLFEDIGRHNAVDKAVGQLIEKDQLETASILVVSGRISFEIVIKAYHAGIPFLLAVSAPSSFAVEMCQLWGITVLGYCRETRATVYSHPEQVST